MYILDTMARTKKPPTLPPWATPTPPEEPAKPPARDQVLPPVRVTEAERAKIKAIAAELGISTSELIRTRALGTAAA